ncbi:MAG: helix-turn-helix transcriptional regulator, partial [Anaerovoracaceae bacterium]
MTFGEKIQKLRKEAGLSQEELAHRLKVSRQAVSKWERDSGFPETEKIIWMSSIFNVSA